MSAGEKGKTFKICLVHGVEGPSLYLNDYRVAGNKPWGGGRIVQEWDATEADLLEAMRRDPIQIPRPKKTVRKR